MTTTDKIIRIALRATLEKELKKYRLEKKLPAEIFEELGVRHGKARIDIAVVNGVMHGYEIKSDRDTLQRLPEQMGVYNSVFDHITLVVGKSHLYDAINLVPDWWGITLTKFNADGQIVFHSIREAKDNKDTQVPVSIARMLWRAEALKILEERNEADGIRSKTREVIYKKLAEVLEDDIGTLKEYVRNALLISRGDWRSVAQPVLSGD